MATLYNNPRGGLIVDRDSLHASPGYARQVEALKQLRERKVNADVEKAVKSIARKAFAFDAMVAAGRISQELADESLALADGPIELTDTAAITQALRDQEAEIARLRKIEEERWAVVATRNAAVMRAEKADALLRHVVAAHTGENVDGCDMRNADIDHITAHLGGEHE